MPDILLLVFLLAGLIGFLWPTPWIAVIPLAGAGLLVLYVGLSGGFQPGPNGDNEGGIAFFAIVVLAVAAELALLAGALARAALNRVRGQQSGARRATRRSAAAALAAFALVSLAAIFMAGFLVTGLVLASVAAVAWFVRLGRKD